MILSQYAADARAASVGDRDHRGDWYWNIYFSASDTMPGLPAL